MIRTRRLVWMAVAAALLVPKEGRAQSDSVLYELRGPPSDFAWGCFDPCACPIVDQGPLTGSFILRLASQDPLYTTYDVLDVRWKTMMGAQSVSIVGKGIYRRGGEVAVQDQLTLDLSFAGKEPQRFDSGLRPPMATFPAINTRISLHAEFCLDSVLAVDARPLGVTAVVDHSPGPTLTVSPNPFWATTAFAFTLPRAGVVDLAAFDLAGRRVRTLAHEWESQGAHARSWDGRDEGGQLAKPGLYLVRLVTAGRQATRMVARVR